MTRPISSTGWCTLVSSGSVWRHTGESSKPTTATSSGTRRPASRRTRIAPTAMRSDAAKTPSGGRPDREERPHTGLAAGLAVVTRRRAQVPAVQPRRGEGLPRPPEPVAAGRHVLRPGQHRDATTAGGDEVPDGEATTVPVVDVDDARRVDPGRSPAAHGRDASRLDHRGEVVRGVQGQQEHAVDVLAGEVGGDPVAVALAPDDRQHELERRVGEALADATDRRREVGLAEDAVARLGHDEGDGVGPAG